MPTEPTRRRRRRPIVTNEEKQTEMEVESVVVTQKIARVGQLRSVRAKKTRLIASLRKHLGVVSIACDKAEVSRTTFYRWMKEDAVFKENVDEIEMVAVEFVQHKMFEQVNSGDSQMIRWYMDRKGHLVGMPSLKQHLEIGGDPNNPIKVDGHISVSDMKEKVPEVALRAALKDMLGKLDTASEAEEAPVVEPIEDKGDDKEGEDK